MPRLAVAYLAVLAALRFTLASPEGCTEPTADALADAAQRAAVWLADGQKPDGSYLYVADRSGRDLGGYNEVRHAGVMLSLYQAGELAAARTASSHGSSGKIASSRASAHSASPG